MRPPDHSSEDYARDGAALSRMLRRVLSDTKLDRKDRKELEEHLRALIAKVATLKRK